MTFWCLNEMMVTGDEADLTRFLGNCKGRVEKADDKTDLPLCFSALLPTPPELMAPGCSGWHDWRVENWGTKLEPSIMQASRPGPTTAEFSFETDSGPPIA